MQDTPIVDLVQPMLTNKWILILRKYWIFSLESLRWFLMQFFLFFVFIPWSTDFFLFFLVFYTSITPFPPCKCSVWSDLTKEKKFAVFWRRKYKAIFSKILQNCWQLLWKGGAKGVLLANNTQFTLMLQCFYKSLSLVYLTGCRVSLFLFCGLFVCFCGRFVCF